MANTVASPAPVEDILSPLIYTWPWPLPNLALISAQPPTRGPMGPWPPFPANRAAPRWSVRKAPGGHPGGHGGPWMPLGSQRWWPSMGGRQWKTSIKLLTMAELRDEPQVVWTFKVPQLGMGQKVKTDEIHEIHPYPYRGGDKIIENTWLQKWNC